MKTLVSLLTQFTISNSIFLIIIGLLTIYITFETAKGELTKSPLQKGFWKKHTNRGKKTLIACFTSIILLLLQECNNQNINRNTTNQVKKDNQDRDSIITASIDSGIISNRRGLFNDLSDAFKEQNLKIDTLEGAIIVLKDSIKTTVNNYKQSDPVIALDMSSVTLTDGSKFKIKVYSADAGSSNLNVDMFLYFEYFDAPTLSVTKLHNLNNKDLVFNAGGSLEIDFEYVKSHKIKYLYIYFKGAYSNIDRSKDYKIDALYQYFPIQNITQIPSQDSKKTLINKLNSLPIGNLPKTD